MKFDLTRNAFPAGIAFSVLSVLCVIGLSSCASYGSWKKDPLGIESRNNAAYWDGWRVGFREGRNAAVSDADFSAAVGRLRESIRADEALSANPETSDAERGTASKRILRNRSRLIDLYGGGSRTRD